MHLSATVFFRQPWVMLLFALFAYDTALNLKWCTLASCTSNTSAFTVGYSTAFGLPTIVNGYAYIPTTGITGVATNSTTCIISQQNPSCDGVVVYSGN